MLFAQFETPPELRSSRLRGQFSARRGGAGTQRSRPTSRAWTVSGRLPGAPSVATTGSPLLDYAGGSWPGRAATVDGNELAAAALVRRGHPARRRRATRAPHRAARTGRAEAPGRTQARRTPRLPIGIVAGPLARLIPISARPLSALGPVLACDSQVPAMRVGATVSRTRLRVFSLVSLTISPVFGTATGLCGPRIPKDLPTPWAEVEDVGPTQSGTSPLTSATACGHAERRGGDGESPCRADRPCRTHS